METLEQQFAKTRYTNQLLKFIDSQIMTLPAYVNATEQRKLEILEEVQRYVEVFEAMYARIITLCNKSINDITDEDAFAAIKICKMISTPNSFITQHSHISKIKQAIIECQNHNYKVVDFLRMQGYYIENEFNLTND